MLNQDMKQLCRLFARVIEYPGSSTIQSASDCSRLLEKIQPSGARSMQAFAEFTSRQGLEKMEELYTQTFDISHESTLYLGHYLFGETQKRNSFMVQLQDAYKSCDFTISAELADHLCTMLHFLSLTSDAGFAIPLLDECIIPSLNKIEKTLQKDKNGYAHAITAMKTFLQQVSRNLVKTGGLQYA